ncbi:MAG: hypothetical protein EXX96DRAFT_593747 [Benjaminiella poitrasii]|nr:MAG: hypothetical protein EXX96DRAFT_593747 [Benjaminiella poitrasii]
MYNPSNLNSTYDKWLQNAHLLDPPFDYFSFADLVLKDNRITNILYVGILTKNMNTSSKHLGEGVKALRLFESRSKGNSAFCITYETYWSKRNEDSIISSMRKRQLEGASNITNDIISSMEHIIKKSCTTSSSTSANSSAFAIPTTNTVQTKEPHTPNSSENETKDALNTIKHVDKR